MGCLHDQTVILGDNLASLSGANHALDLNPEMEIQIITERAEIGLVERLRPAILVAPMPSTGYPNGLSDSEPTSKAVRGSWLQKAMGIQLAKRGCIFHLRTRIITISDDSIDFLGPGPLGGLSNLRLPSDFCSDSVIRPNGTGASVDLRTL